MDDCLLLLLGRDYNICDNDIVYIRRTAAYYIYKMYKMRPPN